MNMFTQHYNFLWGCTFFLTKNLMTLFFSHHHLLHGHIRHILPPTTFLSHLGGSAPHQIQPHFSLIPTKMPRKNIFVALWVHLQPLATPMNRNSFYMTLNTAHEKNNVPYPLTKLKDIENGM